MQRKYGQKCDFYCSLPYLENIYLFFARLFSEQKESSDSTRLTDKSCESVHQVNEFISSIAEKIDSNQVDIQTKRLYKRYMARKQQDLERKKEVHGFKLIAF